MNSNLHPNINEGGERTIEKMINQLMEEIKAKGLEVTLEDLNGVKSISFEDESRIVFMSNMNHVSDPNGLGLDLFFKDISLPSTWVNGTLSNDQEASIVAVKLAEALFYKIQDGKIIVWANIWNKWDNEDVDDDDIFDLIRTILSNNFYLITDYSDSAEMKSKDFDASFGAGRDPNIYFRNNY